jgi:hypothetical protein
MLKHQTLHTFWRASRSLLFLSPSNRPEIYFLNFARDSDGAEKSRKLKVNWKFNHFDRCA